MPAGPNDLTTVAAVKVDLGIAVLDTSEDAYIQSLISSESQNFMNLIHRQDFSPVATFTDYLMGNDDCKIYLNHYPIQTVTSLTVNGTVIPVWSSGTPDTLGYVFDNTVPVENRVALYLRGTGAIFPKPCWPYYRGVVVVYTAGYAIADVPANVKRMISDIIAIRRGISQIQQATTATQIGTTLTLGDYTQGDTSGSTSSSSTRIDELPASIQSVIDQYSKPQI